MPKAIDKEYKTFLRKMIKKYPNEDDFEEEVGVERSWAKKQVIRKNKRKLTRSRR